MQLSVHVRRASMQRRAIDYCSRCPAGQSSGCPAGQSSQMRSVLAKKVCSARQLLDPREAATASPGWWGGTVLVVVVVVAAVAVHSNTNVNNC